jgi:hypothetical protein
MSTVSHLWPWIKRLFSTPSAEPAWFPAQREQTVERAMEAGFDGITASIAWESVEAELEQKLAAESDGRSDSAPGEIRDDQSDLDRLRAVLATDVDPYKGARDSWASARAIFREAAATSDAEIVSRPLAICTGAGGLALALYRRSDPREAALIAAIVILLIYGAPALLTLMRAALSVVSAGQQAVGVAAVRIDKRLRIGKRVRRIRANSRAVARDQARARRLKAVLAADFRRGYALGVEARGSGVKTDDGPAASHVDPDALDSHEIPANGERRHVN